MLLLWTATALAVAPPLRSPCGTPPELERLAAARFRPLRGPSRPRGAGKAERDACRTCTWPHLLTSPNFVVKWGDDMGDLSAETVAELLDEFETAWAEEVEGWDLPAPPGADTWLFNVYIGDTGDGTPSSYGTGGYFTVDGEGFPMIVVALASMEDPDWRATVAAHEFFHAVQYATGGYLYEGEAAWYWEATASWAAGEVFPESPLYASFLGGYALLPELPLSFFDYPDEGTLQELHQYGAFIFPRYLSEVLGEREVVLASWREADPAAIPLDELDGLLGGELAPIFGDFVARNTTWDYRDGDWYAEVVAQYATWYATEEHLRVAVLSGEGSQDWIEPTPELAPQVYGANLVLLTSPEPGRWALEFDGDPVGGMGSPAAWEVRLVEESGEGALVWEVPVDDEGRGELTWTPDALRALHVVVAAVPDAASAAETFGYRLRLFRLDDGADEAAADPVTPDEAPPAGCGCAAGGPRPAAWWWLALPAVAAGAARRRPADGLPPGWRQPGFRATR